MYLSAGAGLRKKSLENILLSLKHPLPAVPDRSEHRDSFVRDC